MELDGRVALVTGGAVRLGRAFAEALAGRGMRVAVHYGSSSREADEVVAALRSRGADAAAFGADLRDVSAALKLVDDVVQHFGQLDLLLNSAAVMERIGVADTSAEQWDDVLNLNLRAPFFLAQRAAPHLAKTHGTIINMADLGGLEPWPGYAAHSISKAGVVMLTKVLATALAPDVRVNALAPGTVMVPDDFDKAKRDFLSATTPMQRLGTPEDAVQAMLFLAERADFITGEILVVDGGRVLRR
ncbi:MAG TPA: SDR family oxidoreductase [Gemmatimonadales bacterium]|jgi:pteridine reductase